MADRECSAQRRAGRGVAFSLQHNVLTGDLPAYGVSVMIPAVQRHGRDHSLTSTLVIHYGFPMLPQLRVSLRPLPGRRVA